MKKTTYHSSDTDTPNLTITNHVPDGDAITLEVGTWTVRIFRDERGAVHVNAEEERNGDIDGLVLGEENESPVALVVKALIQKEIK